MPANSRTTSARLRLIRSDSDTPSPAATGPEEVRESRRGQVEGIAADAHTPQPAASTIGGARRAAVRSLQNLPDASLVALAGQGDVGASEQLYRRHASFALNLAARIAGSTHDTEDVVHDAFLKAFSELATLRSPEAFRWWLGSIVVRGMRTRLRRGRLLRLFGLGRPNDPIDLETIASDDAPPPARAELAQIYALLQTIDADDRIAWTLRFVEGRELSEAAQLAGCSLATIKRRIGRAQRFLEDHFVDTGGDQPDQESPP